MFSFLSILHIPSYWLLLQNVLIFVYFARELYNSKKIKSLEERCFKCLFAKSLFLISSDCREFRINVVTFWCFFIYYLVFAGVIFLAQSQYWKRILPNFVKSKLSCYLFTYYMLLCYAHPYHLKWFNWPKYTASGDDITNMTAITSTFIVSEKNLGWNFKFRIHRRHVL